ncbi:tetratricopeptide repeat protein [Teredinibacter sp. KSP-S5-2]|uniref:tetratricopeptide repeat protein n=1 Tax=Teredinibacter sp. KSP-S5-2 TaxID=3034506 RepID=UPI00293451D1|nr:tetratricopeptide repeat protein [Teredinibacter sp. KSP-S5-2]WNO10336.1 tetratricopeptide repeat protein [Teredinibacter sp. KSP-S5-2]
MAERLRELLAEERLEEALGILNEKFDIELSPALHILKAQILSQLNNRTEAKNTYLYVLKRMPQLVRAHVNLAKIYIEENEPKAARDHLAKAVSYGAKDAFSHGQLGYLNLQLHNPWSAISAFQYAIALQPENTSWQYGLLMALSDSGQSGSALSLSSELLKKDPSNPQLWLRRASAALQAEEKEIALSSVEAAIRLGNAGVENKKIAAQLNFQLGNYDRGIELLSETVAAQPEDIELVHQALSWLYQQQLWDSADRLLSKVATTTKGISNNQSSILAYHQGKIAHANRRLNDAIKYFDRAVELNVNNGLAIIALAELYLGKQNFTKAELLYTRAEALDDVRKEAILGKAQVFLDNGDYPSALRQMKLAYRKYPERDDLKDNIELLEDVIRTQNQARL